MDIQDNTQEHLYVDSIGCMVRRARKYPTRDNLIVTYQCHTEDGKSREVTLVLLIEYPGYPKEEARAWFHRRGLGMPPVARYGLRMATRAKRPYAILVEKDGKWDRVVDEYFDDEEGLENDLIREYGWGLKP